MTETAKTLRSFLSGDKLVGDPLRAIDALATREVVHCFEVVAREFSEAILDNDLESLETVEAALELRVALAVRFSCGGAPRGAQERLDDIDASLVPHRQALLMVEEDPGEWLRGLRDDGVDVDRTAWWGYLSADAWVESAAELSDALEEVALVDRYEEEADVRPDRHQAAWEEHILSVHWPRWYDDVERPMIINGNVRYVFDRWCDYDVRPRSVMEMAEWVDDLKTDEAIAAGIAYAEWRLEWRDCRLT